MTARKAFPAALLLCAVVAPLQAQNTLELTVGGPGADYAAAVAAMPDGGAVLVGATDHENEDEQDILVVRLDRTGALLWSRTIGGPGSDAGLAVAAGANGDLLIAGTTSSFGHGSYDMFLVRLDSAGTFLWSQTYGGREADGASTLAELPDGDILIAGYTRSSGAGGSDVLLVRTDAHGYPKTMGTYGGSGDEEALALAITRDGGCVLSGATNGFSDAKNSDIYLLKLDAAGSLLWNSAFGSSGADVGYSVLVQGDEYLVAGTTDGTGAGGLDALLVRVDRRGIPLWSRTFGGRHDDDVVAMRPTSDGGVLMAGLSRSFGFGPVQGLLVRTDSLGGLSWARTFGFERMTVFGALDSDRSDGFLAAGATIDLQSPAQDALMLRIDESGFGGCSDAAASILVFRATLDRRSVSTIRGRGGEPADVGPVVLSSSPVLNVLCR